MSEIYKIHKDPKSSLSLCHCRNQRPNERQRPITSSFQKTTRDSNDWDVYKQARQAVKTTLRKAETDYIRNEVQTHKDKPGCLWKIINNVIPSKERPTLTYSKDHKSVADDFNKFFSSVGRKTTEDATLLASENNINISTTSLPSTPLGYSDELFYLRLVTCTEVQSIIMFMPSNKSPVLDKINMRVIKDSLPVILGPLIDIINCSLSTSTYPSTWKKAEVIPLLKDGDHE